MADFITHPLLKSNTVERRLYQEVLVAQIEEKGNTLVVAPTALGKTVVAALLTARMLEKHPTKKVLFLAPTKPLAVQHQVRMREFLALHPETIAVLTGAQTPEKRKEIFNESTIIAATPQTIENDVLTGKITLNEVQLIIFDEAHRAVKEYSYVFLAQKYMNQSAQPKRILALTASPGSSEEEIQDICKNLFIHHIAVKKMDDEDVKPYINPIKVEWKKVKLPEEFYEIKQHLQGFLHEQLIFFKKIGYARNIHSAFMRRVDLLQLQIRLREDMMKYGTTKPQLYQAVSRAAAVLKVSHAVTLLESQGIHALEDYFDKMQKAALQSGSPKAAKLINESEHIRKAYQVAERLSNANVEHPKIAELQRILKKQFEENTESRVLVFNHYRDSVTFVADSLNTIEGIRAARFIGQATKSAKDKGLSQKDQIRLLDEFREGKFNVLVASSVAEEGLDIPSVDLVIFYEPVPSEIRLIQRRGRTGRKAEGRVIILMAEKTMDEAMYWASKRKEQNMHDTLSRISMHTAVAPSVLAHTGTLDRTTTEQGQANLFQFGASEKLFIYADNREQASTVMKELSFYPDAIVQAKQLEVGDFVVGPDVVIERKTTEDFLSSLMDGRLFNQLLNMSNAYARPLVILEGDPQDLFSMRNIHENAIIGMLSSIALTYRIPLLYTKDAKETAKWVYQIAKREQQGKDKEIRLRLGRKGLTPEEQQQFIMESFPGVGPNAAKGLLTHFGSIHSFVNATTEEMKEVENIGPKKAKAIQDILRSKYEPEKKKTSRADKESEKMDLMETEIGKLDDPLIEEWREEKLDDVPYD
ncbi:MAG: DEAD/DEAH box helicase [archaeon]